MGTISFSFAVGTGSSGCDMMHLVIFCFMPLNWDEYIIFFVMTQLSSAISFSFAFFVSPVRWIQTQTDTGCTIIYYANKFNCYAVGFIINYFKV